MSTENEDLENNLQEELPVEDEVCTEAVEELAEDVKSLEEYNKLKNDYIRLYAEMDNMKKRVQQETEKTIKFAISSFAKELLGVADNLERAITAMTGKEGECADLLKGVELTQNELTKALGKYGIKRFNHVGEKFDPNYERVVQEIDDGKSESGTILTELQAGYTIHDRILREAVVVVAR